MTNNICYLSIFILLILFSGCATTIEETHVFQTKDENGKINYYKIFIDAKANNSKAQYKAGLYDAEALNALLTEVNDQASTDFDTAYQKLRRDAFLNQITKYFNSVGKNSEETKKAKQAVYDVLEPLDIRQKKYAIIYSSLASLIEEAIADFAEDKDTEDVVYAAMAGIKREGYINSKMEQKDLNDALRQAKKIRDDAIDLKINCKNGCSSKVTKLLEDSAGLKTY